MATIIVTGIGTLLTLIAFSILLRWRQRARFAALVATVRAQLEEALTLMQLTQKHRALGAQRDQVAVAQREQIARQIERSWPAWLRQFPEGAQIDIEWAHMRVHTDDFAAHCRSIDNQLIVISRLERRMQGIDTAESIADRCRALEDLGRLRGLSMRAANNTRCSVEFEVPLRYLCLRLSLIDSANAAMHEAVREITEQLLDAPRISIAPARCFELLTPVIDTAIDDIRRSIHGSVSVTANVGAASVVKKYSEQNYGNDRVIGFKAVSGLR